MTYYISRNNQKFGPYSLADLQRYVASGEISPDDLAQSEGMPDWVPVSRILGNIGAASPAPPAPQNYGQVPSYGMPGAPVDPGQYPAPPNLHWGLLLLLTFVTCGIFTWAWMFVEAAYAGKIDRESKSTLFYGLGLPLLVVGSVFQNLDTFGDTKFLGTLMYIGGVVLVIVGHYKLKSSLESHFNSAEPINLHLSGVMTFFFNTIYFQYHFNRINNWRRTGVLS